MLVSTHSAPFSSFWLSATNLVFVGHSCLFPNNERIVRFVIISFCSSLPADSLSNFGFYLRFCVSIESSATGPLEARWASEWVGEWVGMLFYLYHFGMISFIPCSDVPLLLLNIFPQTEREEIKNK